jgi:hypothetical protein
LAGSLASMLAAMIGLSPVMVGRADELARLRELAAETRTGPAVALISGEAGIGKTRLVAELIATLDPTCRCWPARAARSSLGQGPSVVCRGYPRQVSMNPFCGKGFMD